MPSYLHPRSTATSTLFAGTLLASFIVVGIPHVFPCPRPRKGYADSEIIFDADGKPVRRLRKRPQGSGDMSKVDDADASPANALLEEAERSGLKIKHDVKLSKIMEQEAILLRQLQEEAALLEREMRECPVPKPRTLIGRILGYKEPDTNQRHTAQADLIVTDAEREKDRPNNNEGAKPS